jgi:uncharacterized protein (UPF0179 family)
MAETKPKVTLIGKELAKTGLEFIYEGTIKDCGSCRLSKACNNLKKGHRYRIVGVRAKTDHACAIHFNGACSVEVVDSPIPALISADMAIKNTRIRHEFSCTKTTCPNYDLCSPPGIIDGEKYIVAEVLGNNAEPCEKGRSLQLVELMSV